MDNPPAFPGRVDGDYLGGMTLRDYFAAKAMQGLVTHGAIPTDKNSVAKVAWEYADAMLSERNK